MPRLPPEQLARARRLRAEATPAERILWSLLARSPVHRFTRQLAVGPFIADVACRKARLIVELDGSQHAADAAYDRRRSAYLANAGWRVLRFWNTDIRENAERAADAVLAVLDGRATVAEVQPPHPGAIPQRR